MRGFPTPTPHFFEREVGPRGALYVGSPETVATKVAENLPILGGSRFDLKFGMPGMTQDSLMKSIELYGTKVVPQVRDPLAAPAAA